MHTVLHIDRIGRHKRCGLQEGAFSYLFRWIAVEEHLGIGQQRAASSPIRLIQIQYY
jgi:hypothetical protein